MTAPSTDELKALLDGLDDRGALGCLNQLQAMAPNLAAEVIRLREALERIANGPWPDGIDGPEDQARFDCLIARRALDHSNTPSPDYDGDRRGYYH